MHYIKTSYNREMAVGVTVPCLSVTFLLLTNLASTSAALDVECYSCSSDLDDSCISAPSVTVACSTTHGKGCATRVLPDGVVERGCSDIGLSPNGCQVSAIFGGTECVCHRKKCNTGVPANTLEALKSESSSQEKTISCFECDSSIDDRCSYSLPTHSSSISTKACPISNGCYFIKRVDDGGVMNYNRLCFNDYGPATYYPAGCYTVFNEFTKSTTEVCVCYESGCNKDSQSALMSSLRNREEITPTLSSVTSVSNSINYASSSSRNYLFLAVALLPLMTQKLLCNS